MSELTVREAKVMDALQLEGIKNQLEGLLNGNPQKMEAFKARMLKLSTSYMLKDCTPESLIAAGMQAQALDLPLEAGQGYVVKYKNVAQLDIGYKGWQVLAKRAGFSVLADVVYSCDHFEQSGFGFDADIQFEPCHSERKSADDKWVQDNVTAVIVSVREDSTNQTTYKVVERDMLLKIVGMSPSTQTEKGRASSPHENWKAQMLAGKAIKQVVSKMPIDLSAGRDIHEAIKIVNETESNAQQPKGNPPYSAERFEEMYPKWLELIKTGKKKADSIASQLTNGFSITPEQMSKVMDMRNYEPIEGETVQQAEG